MVTILIKEFTTWISVRIFEGGEFPRVRSASSLSHFRTIMSEELAHFGKGNVRIEREESGRFGSLRWCDIAPLVEHCDECNTTENVSTVQLGEFGHESLCEDCREDLLEKV